MRGKVYRGLQKLWEPRKGKGSGVKGHGEGGSTRTASKKEFSHKELV